MPFVWVDILEFLNVGFGNTRKVDPAILILKSAVACIMHASQMKDTLSSHPSDASTQPIGDFLLFAFDRGVTIVKNSDFNFFSYKRMTNLAWWVGTDLIRLVAALKSLRKIKYFWCNRDHLLAYLKPIRMRREY